MNNSYLHEVIRRYFDLDPSVSRKDAMEAAERLGWTNTTL